MVLVSTAYDAAYSLTLCALSKREYPGFSWIYFKVNPLIMISIIAKKQTKNVCGCVCVCVRGRVCVFVCGGVCMYGAGGLPLSLCFVCSIDGLG